MPIRSCFSVTCSRLDFNCTAIILHTTRQRAFQGMEYLRHLASAPSSEWSKQSGQRSQTKLDLMHSPLLHRNWSRLHWPGLPKKLKGKVFLNCFFIWFHPIISTMTGEHSQLWKYVFKFSEKYGSDLPCVHGVNVMSSIAISLSEVGPRSASKETVKDVLFLIRSLKLWTPLIHPSPWFPATFQT